QQGGAHARRKQRLVELLTDCGDVRKWKVGLDTLNLLSNAFYNGLRRADGANLNGSRGSEVLRQRQVDRGLRILADLLNGCVLDDSNDLTNFRLSEKAEAFADGFFAGPEFFGHSLIHDDDRLRACPIELAEQASSQQWNPHRVEVFRTDNIR